MAVHLKHAGRGSCLPGRQLLAAALAGCIGLAGPARAQEPALAGMSHAAWTARDGAPQAVTRLARAPDGTLWVGTDGGLYSFDGRAFTAFQSPAGDPQLPAETVQSLLVTRDGTLWVGFLESGIARIARGRVTRFDTADGRPANSIDQLRGARDGSIWALANQTDLIRFDPRDGAWHQEAGPREVAGTRAGGLYIDAFDVLWLAKDGRVFRRRLPDTTYTRAEVKADIVRGFAETPGGNVWMTDYDMRGERGRTQLVDRHGKPLVTLTHPNEARDLVYAPDGSLVIAMGRVRRYRAEALAGRTTLPLGPGTDSYGSAEGLTADMPQTLLLDADRNVWVGGRRGLDRLGAPRLVPFLPGKTARAEICATTRGEVFVVSDSLGLLSVSGGITRKVPGSEDIYDVFCGDDGVTRAVSASALFEVRAGRLHPIPWIPGAPPFSIMRLVAMPDHTLYVTVGGGDPTGIGGIWRFRDGAWTKNAAEGVLRFAGFTPYVDSRGRLWMGYNRGRVGLPLEGRVYHSGTPGLGSIAAMLETSRGLFAAGTYGLAVLRDTSFQMLRFADGASTRGVGGLVQSTNGDLWLNAVQGIVRVPAAELAAGLADPRYPMKSERVTEGDFTGPARIFGSTTTTARAADGTLWFSMLNGVVSYNPDAPPPRSRPPVLSVRSITADRMPLGRDRRFGPQPRTLAIRYFGVDLTAPDRVRYRYRLDGFDDEWHDAGGRTEAIYTRPGPGTYTFRVMAANEAGAWTAPVSSVAFTVLPSFYQTAWFFALVATVVVLAPAAAALAWQRRRGRLAAERAQARFEAMLAERTRVARELHDTLLGDMAGVAMQLSAGARRAEASGGADRVVVELLAGLGAQVQHTLVEARRSVTAMRAAAEELPPLHERLADAAHRTFAGTGIAVHLEHTGSPRPYAPTVEAEILGVAVEAMANARRHAECRNVTVACGYGPRELRVRVRDDGRGFDPSRPAPVGHWGLVGMRERAAAVGGTLAVTSAPGAGTEVALVLPAGDRRRRWWTRFLPPGQG